MTTIEAAPATIDTTPDELLRRLGASGPRELYDALVRSPGSRPELDRRLEVVAMPNDRAEALRADDLFLRVALGEGFGLLSILVTGELVDRPAAERRGWQLEGTLPGRYAHVVEGGTRPHAREEDWARRIADRDGYLPPGHAVVRLKGPLPAAPPAVPLGEAAEPAEAVDRTSAAYVRWVQEALNRIDSAGLGVDGDVGPLTRAALRRFQQRAGLTATGSVDAQTERALIDRGAPPPPGSGAAAPPAPATFALLLDGDRNGSADTSAPQVATWTWGASGRGAIVLVNNDDDGVDGRPDNVDSRIDGGADASDLAPLTIARTSAGAPPAGTQVDLMVDRADVLRIFSSRAAGGAEVIGPGTGATFRLPSLAPARFEFGMEAVRYAGTGFSGEVRITLRVTDPGGARKDATAVIRVAPWLMPNHLSRAEKVFVVDAGGHNATYRARLRTLVTAAGCTLAEVPNRLGDIWAQDCMEFGFASLPGAVLRTVLRSPQGRGQKVLAPSLLNAGMGLAEVGSDFPENTFDSTGNLECSPPVSSSAGKRYPYGRILYGPGRSFVFAIDDDLREFLRRQVVQEPIEVDTGWLAVGHVDEIVSFVPAPGAKGFRLLMPSPRVAYALLDGVRATDPGAKIFPGRAFLYEGHPDSPVEMTVSAFLGLRDDFLPELRDEIAAGRVHTPKPLRDYNADRQRNLDGVKATLKAGLGLTDADIVELPALFMPNPRLPSVTDALTPGMVNMLVLNRHCIVPKPFGPQTGGPPKVDIFERDVLGKLTPLGLTVNFLDCWSEYHVHQGEVHCSSNTLRSAAPARWWEFQP